MDDRSLIKRCKQTDSQALRCIYEWGLYVSESGKLDQRLAMRSFLGDHLPQSSGSMWLQVAAVIKTPQDFQDLVIAAMAEFSDKGKARDEKASGRSGSTAGSRSLCGQRAMF